jgi:polysaccharide biosynthesis/export protein
MKRRSDCVLCLFLFSVASFAANEPAADPANPAPAIVSPVRKDYILHRGDVLDVRVYNLPELTAAMAIRPDGKIAIPLQDEIEAAGLTAAKLAALITEGYRGEFRNPRVSVIVRSFSNQTVYVGGEVAKPGLLSLDAGLTAFQAVLRAGGIKETAKKDSVMLVRSGEEGQLLVRKVSFEEILKGKPDTVLEPYDVVYVPKTKVARVDKWIDQHIRQMIPVSLGISFSYLFGGGGASLF